MVAEVLAKARLTRTQLELLPASHKVKVDLARRLRRETTMSLKWIAQELAVGSWKYLSNLLRAEPGSSNQPELGL